MFCQVILRKPCIQSKSKREKKKPQWRAKRTSVLIFTALLQLSLWQPQSKVRKIDTCQGCQITLMSLSVTVQDEVVDIGTYMQCLLALPCSLSTLGEYGSQLCPLPWFCLFWFCLLQTFSSQIRDPPTQSHGVSYLHTTALPAKRTLKLNHVYSWFMSYLLYWDSSKVSSSSIDLGSADFHLQS